MGTGDRIAAGFVGKAVRLGDSFGAPRSATRRCCAGGSRLSSRTDRPAGTARSPGLRSRHALLRWPSSPTMTASGRPSDSGTGGLIASHAQLGSGTWSAGDASSEARPGQRSLRSIKATRTRASPCDCPTALTEHPRGRRPGSPPPIRRTWPFSATTSLGHANVGRILVKRHRIDAAPPTPSGVSLAIAERSGYRRSRERTVLVGRAEQDRRCPGFRRTIATGAR